jgi:hypothetical protein
MDFKIDEMAIHFNKCASDYDRHFYEDLGMCEFYDEIENQINICGKPKNILVLGCGTGLEIERIKHSAIVTAIDIPLALGTELAILSDAGFNSLSVEKRWNKTALIKAIK